MNPRATWYETRCARRKQVAHTERRFARREESWDCRFFDVEILRADPSTTLPSTPLGASRAARASKSALRMTSGGMAHGGEKFYERSLVRAGKDFVVQKRRVSLAVAGASRGVAAGCRAEVSRGWSANLDTR